MSARDSLLDALRWRDYPIGDPADHEAELDAYRTEVLAEAKTETVAWLVKKAAEQQKWDASVLASKVDRGAVRALLGTGHYMDAMDAHRAGVSRELRRSVLAALLAGPVDEASAANPVWAHGYSAGLTVAADILAADILTAAARTAPESASDFFQPGHSYTARDGSTFRCVAVTTHPDSGKLAALGWHTDTADWTFVGVRNIDHWNHEYDGCQPPPGPAAYQGTRGEPGEGQ